MIVSQKMYVQFWTQNHWRCGGHVLYKGTVHGVRYFNAITGMCVLRVERVAQAHVLDAASSISLLLYILVRSPQKIVISMMTVSQTMYVHYWTQNRWKCGSRALYKGRVHAMRYFNAITGIHVLRVERAAHANVLDAATSISLLLHRVMAIRHIYVSVRSP